MSPCWFLIFSSEGTHDSTTVVDHRKDDSNSQTRSLFGVVFLTGSHVDCRFITYENTDPMCEQGKSRHQLKVRHGKQRVLKWQLPIKATSSMHQTIPQVALSTRLFVLQESPSRVTQKDSLLVPITLISHHNKAWRSAQLDKYWKKNIRAHIEHPFKTDKHLLQKPSASIHCKQWKFD